MVTLPYLPSSLTVSIPVALFLCVCVCFTLEQHDCDGKGNITLLIWPQATAYNCLSVPYGSSAFGTSMQIVFISNGAFPF